MRRTTGASRRRRTKCTVLHDKAAEGNAFGNLGTAYAAIGEADRALEYHQHALAVTQGLGNLRGTGIQARRSGLATDGRGADRKARSALFTEQLKIARDLRDRRSAAAVGNLSLAA